MEANPKGIKKFRYEKPSLPISFLISVIGLFSDVVFWFLVWMLIQYFTNLWIVDWRILLVVITILAFSILPGYAIFAQIFVFQKRKIFLIINIIFIILPMAVFCIREYAVRDYIVHDKQIYAERRFEGSKYGQYSDEFFTAYASTEGCSDYDFYFVKGGNSLDFKDYATESYSLILYYGQGEYQAQKQRVLSEIPLLENDEYDQDDDLICVSSVTIGNNVFYAIDEDDNDHPMFIGLVSFNDDKREISFSYICDGSLDFFVNEASFIEYLTANLPWLG